MTTDVSAVIARIPLWAAAADVQVTPLGGGITNQNYRVDVEGEAFVLRISGANTDLLGIDRQVEHAANQAAAAAGIAPEVVYFLEPEGYLVTRFIEGRPLPEETLRQPETLARVVTALQAFHRLPAIPGSFSAFRVVETYAATAREYGVPFPPDFDWLLERKQEIERALAAQPFTPRPCHNDLLNGNFLDDGAIRILDWEYAGMGDVFFDLANLAINHSFAEEDDRRLLQAYFGGVTPGARARLRLMKVMSDFREAMWGVMQQGISQLEFDFRDYADKHFRRMAGNMRDPGWHSWLQEASHGV
jgi:thiamine kinase-like enzyme